MEDIYGLQHPVPRQHTQPGVAPRLSPVKCYPLFRPSQSLVPPCGLVSHSDQIIANGGRDGSTRAF